MSKSPPPRRLSPDDILYRKVNPGQSNDSTKSVAAAAFQDNHSAQSFFLKGSKTPAEILDFFAGLKGVRTAVKMANPEAEDLFEKGYRIAEVRVADLRSQGFSFEVDGDGNEYNQAGHVSVPGLKNNPFLTSREARLLTEEETFPEREEGKTERQPPTPKRTPRSGQPRSGPRRS